MSDNKNMIYLNTPITTEKNDVIGLSVCADKLSDAIDTGAQMIAITSPFGSGKTSIIDLMQEKRANNKKEHILKIPMWSQLHQLENHTNELHKNFLYQISSLINHRRGTYISRRLSNNYGLFTLHANKVLPWLVFTLALLLACVAWCVNYFSENIESLIPILEDRTAYLTIALVIIAIYMCIVVFTKSEIIFSSQKSENERSIEEDEIIDLYREEILRYGTRPGEWIRQRTKEWKHRPFREHTYIIVVEDLDRTNDGKSVIEFLTELRKYYLPTNYSKSKTTRFKNKVVFIVNIKSESVLLLEIESKLSKSKELLKPNEPENTISKEYSREYVFAKIFDYVLNLQTINIMDYEIVLEGLLKSKKDVLNEFGLKTSGKLIEIPGMLWIVRGKTIDIREIKNRLNKTFLIFETLQNRFPSEKEQISFEKCAIVAYLTTAFEYEFHLTDDIAFQKLIELNIKNDLNEETCKMVLNSKNDEYVKAVLELTKSKLIDDSYRMYFYNYPKNSKIYSYSESIVQKAILYGENTEDLDRAIDNVIEGKSSVIVDSFEKMNQLKLRLPPVIYVHEKLYVQALCHAENEINLWLNNLDKSASSIDKNISEILRILSYDSHRTIYSAAQAKRFCNSWEKVFSEDGLLKLRAFLCQQYPHEINWYEALFFGVHNIITDTEMQFLSIVDCINLMNINNDKFGINEVEYIISRFCESDDFSDEVIEKVKIFLIALKPKIDLAELSKIYLRFMKKINCIVPKLEETVIEILDIESDNTDEDEYYISAKEQENIFIQYQELINQIDCIYLSEQTLKNISKIEKFDGYERYSNDVASFLYTKEFYVDYIVINLFKDDFVDLNDPNIYSAIKEYIDWFSSENKIFRKLRSYIINNATDIITNFKFMFGDDLSIVSKKEFDLITWRKDIDEENILELIPVQLVTEKEAEFISDYFCRRNQYNSVAFKFLQYVAKMNTDVARQCFESLEYLNAIQYFRFAASKKTAIKSLFTDILSLDTCKGKLRFMEITKCLDSGFESSISEELVANKDLQNYYVEIINNNARTLNAITATTLKNLYSFTKYHPMNDIVTERYYRDKHFVHYVVSKANFHKRFDIDSQEKFDVLWPVYVEVFSENYFTTTCSYMSDNHNFLELLIKRNAYEGFSEDVRVKLAKVYQNSDSIKNVLEYGTKFAINYFSSINGFVDIDAARTFVDVVEKQPQILASSEVYENTYEKLWNGPLKAKYTILRKKAGYKK